MKRQYSLIDAGIKDNLLVQYILLFFVMLIAAVLRLYKLDAWSLWGDEMLSVANVPDGFNHELMRRSLSLELIQATIAALGVSEWSARIAPALIGIVSIPILYFPIRRLLGPVIGLVAVLLLALSPWHLYWSQNARFYVLLFLFYGLLLLTFHIGLEEDRPGYLFISLFFLALAARERLLAFFFVPVVLGYIVLLFILGWEKPRGLRLRNLSIFLIPGMFVTVLFAAPYVRAIPLWFSSGFDRVNNNPFWLAAGFGYYVGIAILCVGATGMLYLFHQKNRTGLLLAINAVLPILILMAISPFHYTANRYAFISLISWVILASLALVELCRRAPGPTRILAVGVLLYLMLDPLSQNVLYYGYQHGNRDNWRAAFEFVQQHRLEGDRVVSAHTLIGDYYLQDSTEAIGSFDFSQLATSNQRVWFVEDMNVAEMHPAAHDWLLQHANAIASFDVHVQARNFKMRVYLYDPGMAGISGE